MDVPLQRVLDVLNTASSEAALLAELESYEIPPEGVEISSDAYERMLQRTAFRAGFQEAVKNIGQRISQLAALEGVEVRDKNQD